MVSLAEGQASPPERSRSDALPEHTRYRDDGCDRYRRCLTCPLVRCRYDEPGGVRALLNAHRDRQIVDLRRQGYPVEALAERFGISRRTVFRVLEHHAAVKAKGRRGSSGRTRERCAGGM